MYMQKTTKKVLVLAIDGEPAAGKGTLAKGIAKYFNMLYMDTGAMFRAFGLYFINNNIEITDNNIQEHINNINIDLEYKNLEIHVFLNGVEVTNSIRSTKATMAAKIVSQNKLVREKMTFLQRNIAKKSNSVIDGQDIGTVIFPDADVKIFLVADIDEKARRRKLDFDKKGEKISFEKVKNDILQRTKADYERKIAPLKKAEDAYLIDNTNLTKEETLQTAIKIINEKLKDKKDDI